MQIMESNRFPSIKHKDILKGYRKIVPKNLEFHFRNPFYREGPKQSSSKNIRYAPCAMLYAILRKVLFFSEKFTNCKEQRFEPYLFEM
jgi:hypothetical protein